MAGFGSDPYQVEVYSPGAVMPHRLSVVFTKRDGSSAVVSSGDITFLTGPRSCTCVDFTLGDQVCLHMRARERAFRRFAREYGLNIREVQRPIWAEDISD